MLEKLAEKHSKWYNVALYICRDTDLAKDLVQDMYLYFYDKDIEVNDFYVQRKIYSLFIDYIRKQNYTVDIDSIDVKCNNDPFSPTDEEYEILLRYENLSFIEKELLEEHIISGKSFRDINKEYPLINYGFAFRTVKQAKNKLRGDE